MQVVGRAAELDRLGALLTGARNGIGGTLFIEGEPGIGKTTLLDTALASAHALRALRLTGIEVESAIAYGALQRLGRPLAEYGEGLGLSALSLIKAAAK